MKGIESVCASLVLEHHVLDPHAAINIIEVARLDPDAAVVDLFEEVSESELLKAIAEELGFEYISISAAQSGLRNDNVVLAKADERLLRRYSALPLVDGTGQVAILVANPTDPDIRQYLEQIYDHPKILLGSRSQIQARLALTGSNVLDSYDDSIAPPPIVDIPVTSASRNPLVAWVDTVLETAVAQEASDVHFEWTDAGTLLLRLRLDGVLRMFPGPQRGRESEVINMIMNRAHMDSANQREPQDGAFTFTSLGRKIDVRALMLPQVTGPSIVLRLLDSSNVRRRLTDMGFSPEQLRVLSSAVRSPQGTIVVCGPTGSGKTTTLYALTREVATVEKKVITIEDPVEYRLPLVNQTAVSRTSDGRAINFPRALRAILRADPDVILVGEMRDTETAQTAMDAAITGHLVLSTIHARDAVGIYTRLTEMKVPNYLVADAMTLGVSQRLARRLHNCAQYVTPTEDEALLFKNHGLLAPTKVGQPIGCDGCNGLGYQGRVAVVEVLNPTKAFRQLILDQAGHDALMDQAIADGFVPMMNEGLRLVAEGITGITEIRRVVEIS